MTLDTKSPLKINRSDLDPKFVLASDLESYFVDKDSGAPLAAGKLSFFRDAARDVPKQVFALSGSQGNYTYTSMGTSITLSSVGTVQDAGNNNQVIYWYPYDEDGTIDLYYVEVVNSQATPQFVRQAWPNTTTGSGPTPTSTENGNFENQISNPTFTNVFLNPGISNAFTVTAATSQVFPLGPDWDFVISGSGTVTVQQILVRGSQNVVTSPPYVLDVNVSSGITRCYLRQRFFNNSGIWGSTNDQPVYLYGSFVAQAILPTPSSIGMFYVESSGNTSPLTIIPSTTTFGTPYELISGYTAAPVPPSTNSSSGSSAYSDIYLSFTQGTHNQISAIQLIPLTVNPTDLKTIPYDLNSSNRDEAFQGCYYIPRLNQKQIDSFLTGWDFQVNPYQFGNSGTVTTTPAYIADQTIAACGTTGNVAWTTDLSGGLQFLANGSHDAFYIQQYLSGEQVEQLAYSRLSVNIFAYQGPTGEPVTVKIYLCSAFSSAAIPTLPTPLGTIDASGKFTLTAAGWTTVPRSGLPTPEFTLKNEITGKNDTGFSGWEITDNTARSSTKLFAIVVTFQYPTAATLLVVESISCVPGDLPCRPAVKTPQQTLLDCQYYYEKSYSLPVLPGSFASIGSILYHGPFAATTSGLPLMLRVQAFPTTIPLSYKTIKREVVDPKFYSTLGTPNSFRVTIFDGPSIFYNADVAISGSWLIRDEGYQGCNIVPTNRGNPIADSSQTASSFPYPLISIEALVQFQYVVDARLGIV